MPFLTLKAQRDKGTDPKVKVRTCNDVLRVSGEGAVPHPASGRLPGVVAFDAQLRHQGEVGRPPDLAGLIRWAGGQ